MELNRMINILSIVFTADRLFLLALCYFFLLRLKRQKIICSWIKYNQD